MLPTRVPEPKRVRVEPLFGIAPGGACRAGPVASPAVSSYLTVSPLPRLRGRLFSVALSLGLPRPGVTRHRRSVESGLSSKPWFRGHPAIRNALHMCIDFTKQATATAKVWRTMLSWRLQKPLLGRKGKWSSGSNSSSGTPWFGFDFSRLAGACPELQIVRHPPIREAGHCREGPWPRRRMPNFPVSRCKARSACAGRSTACHTASRQGFARAETTKSSWSFCFALSWQPPIRSFRTSSPCDFPHPPRHCPAAWPLTDARLAGSRSRIATSARIRGVAANVPASVMTNRNSSIA